MKYKGFMQQNALKSEKEKYIVSKRFLDEDGKPMEWELKSLSRMEDEEILNRCLKMGSKGLELDNFKYIGTVIASSVAYPDLNNAELQDSYGVKSNQELLRAMLTAKEFFQLQSRISFLGSEKLIEKKLSRKPNLERVVES